MTVMIALIIKLCKQMPTHQNNEAYKISPEQ